MKHHEKPAFTHRPDLAHRGKTLSFCNHCFETVARSYWEFELDSAEDSHACDHREREYWDRLKAESKARATGRKEPQRETGFAPATAMKSAEIPCVKNGNRSTF